MPVDYAAGKAPDAGGASNQPPGRLDHLLQAAGDLEIADCRGLQPFEIIVLVVQMWFPRHPSRRERHDQILPTAARPRQHLAPAGQRDNVDLEPGLLVDLAVQRCVQGFAEFHPAAGQRIEAFAGRTGAADQKHLAVTKDCAGNGKLGVGRLGRRGQEAIQNRGKPAPIMPD